MTERSTRRLMTAYAGLLDEAWLPMEPNLAGLTDDEYSWEPAPGCWSVRPRAEVRSGGCWGRGDWVVEVGSEQPTMTTIGWRLMHAFDCVNDYGNRAFGRPQVELDELEVAGHAAGAVLLMTGAVDRLRNDLATADDDRGADDDHDRRRGTSTRSGSLPPRVASRRALSRSIRARRAIRTCLFCMSVVIT